DCQRVFTEERRSASEQIEMHGADAVNIRRRTQVFCWTVRLLRRDEPRCSEASQSSGEIGRRLERLGESEIAHQRFAVLVQQNISRFQIAVQNAFTVCVLHGTTKDRKSVVKGKS